MKHLQLLLILLFAVLQTRSQIKVEKAKEIEVYKGRSLEADNNIKTKPTVVEQKSDLSFFTRKWRTGVTNAFYTTQTGGYTYLHISANAQTKPLYINADGTYYWEAYGEKRKGYWQKTDDKDYPIVLKNSIEGKNWYVCQNEKNGIYIWDKNAISYTGVPL
ncbi:MAG: hypothetical protein P0Y49_02695 [Candidatus Pedobacter colombiensis]|uniref:Uncharacterized protein n=1 Tax=Candidatus Pedobacter colombiensis TaxID=3121371 RepID=A0AAJ5W8K4_9SPHI|nr:hypothetical protein [Pedobacter sp.]WEK20061.1 MAG: hypothetical protein P0Y49_02695 [Pedobacter sp.]